jgi:hypothetical protein
MSETDEIDLLEETEVIEKGCSATPLRTKKKAFENPLPKVVIKKKVIIKQPTPSETESDDEEEEVVAPVKVKKERTQKQKDAFERCILKKKECASKRNEDAKRLAAFDKAALEEKVVKKAISIKKKQIKKQSALDEISDDDTPIEKVKEIAKRPPITPVKQIEKPKITFRFV